MLTTDYLIIGSGTAGMSFADQLLTDTNATIGIIDRHHMPGGHWNDAYSFVRLHQPSAFYGVGSRQLGSNRIDVSSLNRGYYELASGPEIVSYFDRLMQERFLPSGPGCKIATRLSPATPFSSAPPAEWPISWRRRPKPPRSRISSSGWNEEVRCYASIGLCGRPGFAAPRSRSSKWKR